MTTPLTPFVAGSVSVRLYPHNDLPAPEIVAELCAQGTTALDAGFDGVMTSEHHGGVGGYMPNPLQMASFILESSPRGWAAACPLLLPLRPTALVAEEVAWLAARHPGRVGLGVGSGALPLDFEVMGLDVTTAGARFKAELPRLAALLAGRDLGDLGGDKALRACATDPVPLLSAAVSVTAARRAARCGVGLILEGMSPTDTLTRLCAAYDEAGGTQPKVLIRRVWLGKPSAALVEGQRQFYASFRTDTAPMPADQTVGVEDGREMAEALAAILEDTGADALNLRVHLPGVDRVAAREQISGLGADVLPVLRARLTSVREDRT